VHEVGADSQLHGQDREARPFQDGMYSLMNWLLNRHTVCVLKPELVAVEQIFPLFKVSL